MSSLAVLVQKYLDLILRPITVLARFNELKWTMVKFELEKWSRWSVISAHLFIQIHEKVLHVLGVVQSVSDVDESFGKVFEDLIEHMVRSVILTDLGVNVFVANSGDDQPSQIINFEH